MHQPVGLSFEVAYEIPYVKLKNTHCQQALRAKRLLTSALVASMPQPFALSFEVAYEIPYVKLKTNHCQQAFRAKRLLRSALVA